jgi:hypothetical protein
LRSIGFGSLKTFAPMADCLAHTPDIVIYQTL